MPESKVGSLSAELKANIAAFTANMKAAGFASEGFADSMTAAGQKFSEAGVRFSATNKLVADFQGTLDKRKAEEYAAAVEKIGGAARLTEADQRKVNAVMTDALSHYKALGQEAPAHLQAIERATRQSTEAINPWKEGITEVQKMLGIGFSVEKVIEFGKHVIETAGRVEDLSDQMGVSIETVQRFQYAADQSGTSVETIGKSMNFLNKTLVENSTQTRDILKNLGLSVEDLRSKGSEEAFRTVVAAIKDMNDPMLQAEATSKLLGKGLNEMLGLIRSDALEASKSIEVMSDDTVRHLKAAEDAWKRLEQSVTVITGNIIADVLRVSDNWKYLRADLANPITTVITFKTTGLTPGQILAAQDRARAAAQTPPPATVAPPIAPDYVASLKVAREALNALTTETKAQINAALALGKNSETIAKDIKGIATDTQIAIEVVDLYKQRLQDAKTATTKLTAENKAFQKVFEELEGKMRAANEGTGGFQAWVKGLKDITLYSTPALVATKALAEANKDLSPEVQKSVRNMIDAGYSANEAYKNLKELGQVSAEDARAVETFGNAYKKLEDEFKSSASNAGGLGKLIATLPKVTLHLDASVAAAIAVDEAHRKLAPNVIASAEAHLKLGMSAEKVFETLKQEGVVTDADKDKILALAKAHDDLGQSVASMAQSVAAMSSLIAGDTNGMARQFALVATSLASVATGVGAAMKAWSALTKEGGFNVQNLSALAAGWVGVAVAAYQVGNAIAKNVQAGHQFANVGLDIANEMGDLIAANRALVTTPVVSTGLATDIAKLADQLKQMDMSLTSATARHYAELLRLDQIIKEQGGLTSENMAGWIQQSERLFEVIKRGGQVGKQAVDELNTLVGQFAAETAKSGGIWSEAFKKLMADAKAAGVELQAVTDLVKTQQDKLTAGVVGMTAATGTQAKTFSDLKTKLDDANKSLADLIAKGADQDEITKATEAVTKAQTDLATVTVTSQDEFDRLSRISLAAFNGLIASGVDVVSAMNQIGPGIDNLIETSKAFGLAGNDAFNQLSRWRELTTTNADLLNQVGSLNDIMVTLTNLGSMTADTFADIEAQGTSAFDKLVAAGFSENEALVQMKPFLETALKLHKEKGYAIDDNTQKLIAQATAQGILTDDEIDTNDILMQGIAALIEALGGTVPAAWKKALDAAKKTASESADALDKTGKAGEGAAKQTEDAWNRVRITVPVHFDVPDVPGGPGPGTSSSPQSAAYEGFFKMPTTIRVGDDPMGEGEFVLHKRTLENLVAAAAGMGAGQDLASALSTLPAPIAFPPSEVLASTAPPVLSAVSNVPTKSGAGTVIVTLDRRFLAQAVVPELEGEVRRLGFGPNR
jgi:hypothetical protein